MENVEKVEKDLSVLTNVYEFRHLRLYPTCNALQASGEPIGEVTIKGKVLRVRCGTARDKGILLRAFGKPKLLGKDWNLVRDGTPEQLAHAGELALNCNGKDDSPNREKLLDLPLFYESMMQEIAAAFSWASGPLCVEPPATPNREQGTAQS